MQNLEKRIAALEANASTDSNYFTVVQIFPEDGESSEQAIRRAGHNPDAPDTMFICFVAMTAN